MYMYMYLCIYTAQKCAVSLLQNQYNIDVTYQHAKSLEIVYNIIDNLPVDSKAYN